MKLALAQISMTENMRKNLEKSLLFCDPQRGMIYYFFRKFSFRRFFLSMKKEMLIITVLPLIRKRLPD